MKPTLVLFNGPPRVGKDLATSLLIGHLTKYGKTAKQLEFKHFLRLMAKDFSELSDMDIARIESTGDKDAPDHRIPMGRSWRQWLIHISENVIKPIFGTSVFGELMLLDITRYHLGNDYIVLSDCGFTAEVKVLVDAGFPVTIVRLHREGCTFQNDSREYIHLKGVPAVDMDNNGTKAALRDAVAAMFSGGGSS